MYEVKVNYFKKKLDKQFIGKFDKIVEKYKAAIIPNNSAEISTMLISDENFNRGRLTWDLDGIGIKILSCKKTKPKSKLTNLLEECRDIFRFER